MTNLEENYNKKNESNELKEDMIQIEEKRNEDNEIYENLIKMLRNEIRNLKTNEKNLKDIILKLEQKINNPFNIINNYNSNYKNYLNFLSNRFPKVYRGNNNDKYRSKTSPIKSKSSISIFSKDKNNKNFNIKKQTIFNHKKSNINDFYRNSSNYTKLSHYSNNVFEMRFKNKKLFNLNRNNSTLDNYSLRFNSHSKDRKNNNNSKFIKIYDQNFTNNNSLIHEHKLKPIIKGKKVL